jgi:lipopolysaccharide transport system ATP-binding protein
LSDPLAIELDSVTKEFHRGSVATMGFKSMLLHPHDYLQSYRRHQRFRAVESVSLNIRRGECFGIIGRNGSGKSTLLGLIAGVMRPNSGTVKTRGRISPLLELGAGFHPELTGLDNILLNGVLLGMTRRQVLQRRDSIIEFAELKDFVDQPIRTYSSGMLARLGFSVAVHLEPDILLVDEILAVGDEAFQAKCFERIKQFRRAGVTTVFVSHAMSMIQLLCDRVALLHGAHLMAVGIPGEVIPAYRDLLAGGERAL